MKPQIKEIIVVEGRDDITAVKAAVDAVSYTHLTLPTNSLV